MNDSKKLNRIIFILSIIGILLAIYVLSGFLRGKPIICVNTGCELVRKNPASYILGIPVPAFGLVGYTLLTILSLLKTASTKKWISYSMMGISLFGISFVTWFTLTEIFIIKGICTWCSISTFIMYTIFILNLKIFLNSKKPH